MHSERRKRRAAASATTLRANVGSSAACCRISSFSAGPQFGFRKHAQTLGAPAQAVSDRLSRISHITANSNAHQFCG